MESTKLKLYVGADFVSAFAMSAYVALKEKQLSFELVTLDLKARENYQASYQDVSLTCKIPTLVHEGFALSESSAIAEYLDEIAPGHPKLFPLDIKQRARARQLQAWLRSDLLVIRKERPADLIYFGKKETPLSDEARQLSQGCSLSPTGCWRRARTICSETGASPTRTWQSCSTDWSPMAIAFLRGSRPMCAGNGIATASGPGWT